jgi:Cd(II)/Pb(II)-responsive transcriptional regulator
MSSSLKIGDLAKRTDCPIETIRFYEQEGLLPAAARSSSNYRLYGDVHVERLQFIRRCRALDMTLDEIRSLLRFRDTPEDDCGEVNLLLDQHIEHMSRRIAELQSLQSQLLSLRGQCHAQQAAKDCGILQSLASAEGSAPANLGTHSGPPATTQAAVPGAARRGRSVRTRPVH